MTRRLAPLLLITTLVASCTDAPIADDDALLDAPATPNQDALKGGLFHDFIDDSKLDAAGHPHGAEVFEGAERCAPTTGGAGDLGVSAQAGRDQPGVLCGASTRLLGDGTFALNVRAVMIDDAASKSAPAAQDPVLEIAVFDGEEQIATRTVSAADFGESGAERDLAVSFRHRGDRAVTFEVRWTGASSARLTYVEIFRATPRLVISPPSQPLDPADAMFEIELQDPPDDLSFEVHCDEQDRTETLAALLDTGAAEWVDTEFRTLVTVPAAQLFEGCASPSRVMVRAMSGGWARETSRVTYLAEPIPCGFPTRDDTAGAVRVLLTGFEPFPASSDRDNSSREAVDAYVAGPMPDEIVAMHAVLPVEYDAAPALVEDLISRCDPDIVVGFGQGRSAVDVETIAYNRKDSAAIAGGVPDNRGVVYGGEPIVEGGPAEHHTALPVDAILARLGELNIRANSSTDPGRYVCNNLFYAVMDVAQNTSRVGGFVHLPRIPNVGETERETLRQTVAAVVDATVDTFRASGE